MEVQILSWALVFWVKNEVFRLFTEFLTELPFFLQILRAALNCGRVILKPQAKPWPCTTNCSRAALNTMGDMSLRTQVMDSVQHFPRPQMPWKLPWNLNILFTKKNGLNPLKKSRFGWLFTAARPIRVKVTILDRL